MITLNDNYSSLLSKWELVTRGITSMDTIISFQKDEITKTETIIKRLQVCLIDQNNALKMFNDERKVMEDEKDYLFQILNVFNKDSVFSDTLYKCSAELDSEQVICENYAKEKAFETITTKRKQSDIIDNDEHLKKRKMSNLDDDNIVDVVNGTKLRSRSPQWSEIIDICDDDISNSMPEHDNTVDNLDNCNNNSRWSRSSSTRNSDERYEYLDTTPPYNNSIEKVSTLNDQFSKDSSDDIIFKNQISIKRLKDKTINVICIKSETADIYIGGSKGMLVRYFNGFEHVYKTHTKQPILYIETVKVTRKTYLIAFTEESIFMYDPANTVSDKQFKIDKINYVFNDGNDIHIILQNGFVKRLNKNVWHLSDSAISSYGRCHSYFPSTQNGRFSLVTIPGDSTLYQVSKNDMYDRRVVNGVKGVNRAWRVRGGDILCLAAKSWWILDRNLKIIVEKALEENVVFSSVDGLSLVITDYNNTVQVFSLQNLDLGEKIFQKTVNGTITAIAMSSNNIYVAMGDTIYIY